MQAATAAKPPPGDNSATSAELAPASAAGCGGESERYGHGLRYRTLMLTLSRRLEEALRLRAGGSRSQLLLLDGSFRRRRRRPFPRTHRRT